MVWEVGDVVVSACPNDNGGSQQQEGTRLGKVSDAPGVGTRMLRERSKQNTSGEGTRTERLLVVGRRSRVTPGLTHNVRSPSSKGCGGQGPQAKQSRSKKTALPSHMDQKHLEGVRDTLRSSRHSLSLSLPGPGEARERVLLCRRHRASWPEGVKWMESGESKIDRRNKQTSDNPCYAIDRRLDPIKEGLVIARPRTCVV